MSIRLFKPTIDSIVSNITRQVEQLRDAAARHHAEHLEHVAAASVSSQKAQVASSERDRATGIASRLATLIEGSPQ